MKILTIKTSNIIIIISKETAAHNQHIVDIFLNVFLPIMDIFIEGYLK